MRASVNKHQQQSDQTCESILEAALELYLTNGIERTNITDIARAIGTHRATVYRYFRSHEEIGFALAERLVAPIVEAYYAELEPYLHTGTGWDKLCAAVLCTNHPAREHRREFRFFAIFDAYLALLPNQPEIGRKLIRVFGTDEFLALQRRLILEGQEDGSIRTDLDTDSVSLAIRTVFVGTWARIDLRYEVFRSQHSLEQPEIIADTACRLLLDGLRALPAARPTES